MATVLSIVIPVYNESEIISDSIDTIRKEASATGATLEIIIIDDGSLDDTWTVIRQLARDGNDVHGIKLSRNFGKERAICAGLEHACGDATIVMDADLQHPPEMIQSMVRIWKETNSNIVHAVKCDRGKEHWFNNYSSRMFYSAMKFLSGYDLEGASDYKLLDRKVVRALRQMPEQYPFFRGMVAWSGYQHEIVRFVVPERHGGGSKWSRKMLFSYGLSNLLSFSAFPLRIVNYLAIVFFIFAIFLGMQSLYHYYTGSAFVGFTTVIILLLIIGSGIFMGLGIIGEYVAKIHEEVKQRPRYFVEDVVNSDGCHHV